MGLFEELQEVADANEGWVPADRWLELYEQKRAIRMGRSIPGLARLIARRPHSDSRTGEEE